MDTIFIIFLLTVSALSLVYLVYGKYQKDKKVKEPHMYVEGLIAMLDGKEELAFSKFRDVVAEDADNIDAYIRIGDILRKYGKNDKALQVHKDLTIRHNITPDQKKNILNSLAIDFIELKDTGSAIAALKELISIDSQSRRAKEMLLDQYIKTGNWESAYETKESLIKLEGGKSKSGLAIFKYLMGEKLVAEKEFHKARLVYKEAIHLNTACTPAYLAIGDSYLAENRMDDAITIWRKMITQAPSEAHLVLGRLKKVLFDVGKYGEISSICNEILAAAETNLTARLTLADYYAKKGEMPMAIEHLNTAVDNYPNSTLPILELIMIYEKAEKKKEVVGLLNKLQDKFENLEAQYTCGRCGYKHKTKIWLCPSCKAVESFTTQ